MARIRRRMNRRDEGRISELPEEMIQLILSKMELTQAIRTSQLSTRWRNLWKSLPYLFFNRYRFSRLNDYTRFVSRYLDNRDPTATITILDFRCHLGSINISLLKKISTQAVTHNCQQLLFSSTVSPKGAVEFPLSKLSCESLKQLSLNSNLLRLSSNPAWHLPNLRSLHLENISFELCCNDSDETAAKSVDLFSKLSNLTDLTLDNCDATGVKELKISSWSLQHLTVSFNSGKKQCEYVVFAPNLLSFNYKDVGGSFLEPVTRISVAVDKKCKQLDLMLVLHLSCGLMKSKGTRPYDEVKSPSKDISKLCNCPPFSSREITSNELIEVSSSFLTTLFKCDLDLVTRPARLPLPAYTLRK